MNNAHFQVWFKALSARKFLQMYLIPLRGSRCLDMCAHAADAAKVHLILYRFGSCQLWDGLGYIQLWDGLEYVQLWDGLELRVYPNRCTGTPLQQWWLFHRVGQDRIYTPYMTVYLVISQPDIPYIHRIYMVLAFAALSWLLQRSVCALDKL